ncbi:uncharacterized protein LOC113202974 isoform X1 [Frankliniella occidentalis]|uniref:Uncharacterized protein LOC113202974 isoform X1 n=1 Tax=Frankliniella occidentalis TaxID=133901 RepID=A0A6J1RY15_FRAOC|nr:uncharacterized protein LOC113202974 isoform X1 [Frankliniella occidentalis]
MELLLLPEEMLLALMRYLDARDLLCCRLVCKRIGQLALHPHLWRRLRVYEYEGDRHLACPVLRLAPLLGLLDAEVPSKECQLALASTRCAVTELQLTVHQGGAVLAAAVIRNQEALGRLKRLDIAFSPWDLGTGVDLLLRTVALTSGLESLSINEVPFHSTSTVDILVRHSTRLCKPSLRKFRGHHLQYASHAEAFVDFVLASHAASLEEVDLLRRVSWEPEEYPVTASRALLLAGMPNLRKLSCFSMPGLEAVAVRETLEVVTLAMRLKTTSDADRVAVAAAAEFLRRGAGQLREVTLIFHIDRSCASAEGPEDDDDDPDRVNTDFITALATSGRSTVEFLSISGEHATSTSRLQLCTALLDTMPSLSALRRLEVGGHVAVDQLLLGITPASAPVLQSLLLHPKPSLPCVHAWLHDGGDAVGTALSVNPALQVFVRRTPPKHCSENKLCAVCALGCHRDRPWYSDYDDARIYPCFEGFCLLLPRNEFCN